MRRAIVAVAGATSTLLAADVAALGFGRVLDRTTLGEPLNMAVALRLAPGETVDDGCISAEVHAGDERLPADQVRARLTGSADAPTLRITTTRGIDEPVLKVTLSVGCPAQLTREFVTLVDPPGFGAAAVAPESPAAVARDGASDTPPRAAPATRITERRDATRRTDSPPRARRSAVAAAASTPAAPAAAERRVPARARASAAAGTTPRLRIDVAEPASRAGVAGAPVAPAVPAPLATTASAPVSAASAVAALAASTAAAMAAAPSADDMRVRQLEDELARSRAETQRQRDALNAVQSQLAQARSAADSASWTPWLLGLLLALLAALLYLASRVRALGRAQEQAWADRADSALAPPAADSQPQDWPDAAAGVAAVEVTEHEAPEVPALMPDTVPVQDRHAVPAAVQQAHAMEEQADLEQQADFFSALGQDDAAIDLLVTHLRGTGGTHPLPYLKLMDIYRRLGDQDAYGRTRDRFNLRFNAVAPAWDADPGGGRTLEAYPQVIERLQQAWWSPLDAMAELEQLLFQRGESDERFDLAAYQDVVTLYRVARELRLEEEQGPQSAVDVLLPLHDRRAAADVAVRHVDLGGPTTASPSSAIDIELPGPFELDLPLVDDPPPRRG